MQRWILSVVAIVSGLLLVSASAQAKELTNRLGVGYRSSYVTFSLPSVAAVYYPSPEFGVLGSIGVDTQDNNSKFGLLVGIRRILFKEDNMNFFMGGNVAIINNEVNGSKDSGFELSAIYGAEFFLPGLESLGFNVESGAGVTNAGQTRFRTMGDSFVNVGIIFYF
jgi:hypothetical protein